MLNLSLALKYTEHMVYMANDMSVNGVGGGVFVNVAENVGLYNPAN